MTSLRVLWIVMPAPALAQRGCTWRASIPETFGFPLRTRGNDDPLMDPFVYLAVSPFLVSRKDVYKDWDHA
jgi:hypothetical protein